jgi:hypothetical protein
VISIQYFFLIKVKKNVTHKNICPQGEIKTIWLWFPHKHAKPGQPQGTQKIVSSGLKKVVVANFTLTVKALLGKQFLHRDVFTKN